MAQYVRTYLGSSGETMSFVQQYLQKREIWRQQNKMLQVSSLSCIHNGLLSRTAQVGRYQKKHSSTHTHPDHRTYFFIFLHLLGSSLFSLRAWQSSLTTSLQVLVGLPLGLGPSTSYSMHFFSQSWSYFLNTCPYHHRLFCCSTNAMSSIPNLSLSSLLGNLDLLA